MGRPGGRGMLAPAREGLSSGMHPHVVVAKSAQPRFRVRRKLRPLPCTPRALPRPLRGLGRSSSPHRAGRGGTPYRSCQKRNGPCTVQKKRPLRRAPARSRLRATGVGGSVQAPILACLRARFSLLQVCNCRPVADGAEVVGVVIALSLLLFSLPLAVPRGNWCNGRMWASARKHKPLRPPG